jgi:hypothetical protein
MLTTQAASFIVLLSPGTPPGNEVSMSYKPHWMVPTSGRIRLSLFTEDRNGNNTPVMQCDFNVSSKMELSAYQRTETGTLAPVELSELPDDIVEAATKAIDKLQSTLNTMKDQLESR